MPQPLRLPRQSGTAAPRPAAAGAPAAAAADSPACRSPPQPSLRRLPPSSQVSEIATLAPASHADYLRALDEADKALDEAQAFPTLHHRQRRGGNQSASSFSCQVQLHTSGYCTCSRTERNRCASCSPVMLLNKTSQLEANSASALSHASGLVRRAEVEFASQWEAIFANMTDEQVADWFRSVREHVQ
jgi:hypothetical protein